MTPSRVRHDARIHVNRGSAPHSPVYRGDFDGTSRIYVDLAPVFSVISRITLPAGTDTLADFFLRMRKPRDPRRIVADRVAGAIKAFGPFPPGCELRGGRTPPVQRIRRISSVIEVILMSAAAGEPARCLRL